MLSATSTQSPLATVSSVFTMPTVSSVSVANNTGISGLHDQLFTSVPSVGETNSTHTVTDIKPEINGSYLFFLYYLCSCFCEFSEQSIGLYLV